MTQIHYANPMGADDPQDPVPPIEPGIYPDEGAEQSPDERRPEDWRDPNDPGIEQPSQPDEGDPLNAPN
ncbi:hypothetical protein [Pseudomonas sp. F(2018)]|uniref:hypothetical protein n=1 Tax=Pseudomonas sp. F(2018) TaxID=2502240 RepID=UPI0010F51DFE|nr:hypothetical protein [Pseudomonas sp. F(2018)]